MKKISLRFFCILSLAAICLAQALPAQAAIEAKPVSTLGSNPADFISGFLVDRKVTLTVTLTNSAGSNDTFTLNPTWVAGKTWTVELLDQADAPLPGPLPKAVPISSGQQKIIHVRFTAPTTPRVVIGDYETLDLAVSTSFSGNFYYRLQAAASAPFVQAYQYGALSGWTRLQQTNANRAFSQTVLFDDPKYYNTDLYSLAIAPAVSGTEFNAVWDVWNIALVPVKDEADVNSFNIHSNLKSARFKVDSGTPVVYNLTPIDVTGSIFDLSPAVATAPNGVAGVAFIREDAAGSNGKVRNVLMTFIDAAGTPSAAAPINITGNSGPFNTSTPSLTPDTPYFPDFNVSISATADSHFYVTWVQKFYSSGDSQIHQKIGLAVFDAATKGQIGSTLYLPVGTNLHEAPKLISLNRGQQTLLAYLSGGQLLGYNLMWNNLSGVVLGSNQFTIPGINADVSTRSNFDIAVLSSLNTTNLLIAWVDNATFQPKYGIWNTSGTPVKVATSLAIAGDTAEKAWIGTICDVYGNGVITWGNTDYNKIYYSLVKTDGTSLTPPMVQLSGTGIHPGYGAQSNAPLPDPPFHVNIPLVRK